MRVLCLGRFLIKTLDGIEMNPEIIEILENMIRYCEDQEIYDKLGRYHDFYYKAKKILDKLDKE
jgi:hypothetical protein